MKNYVVRIVQTKQHEGGELNGAFIECLRYAGIIEVLESELIDILHFDIRPPRNVDSRMWASQNAERMRTFGFNANSVESI